jgi:peptide/nickel transport system permease protein
MDVTSGDAGGTGAPGILGRSPWNVFWGRFRADRVALAGSALIVVLTALAFMAPVIASAVGHEPNQLFASMIDAFGLPKGPNARFWFGADSSGRDVFVRTVYGARTSLAVAFLATGSATVIGVVLGLAAGFYRGWVDTVISRAIDFVLSLPLLLFAIGISVACSTSARGCLGGLVQPGLRLVVAIIALFTWPYIARIVRGEALSLREKEFVESARALGARGVRIMAREVFPNLAAPVIVYTTLIIPSNILFEAALSFLGVGIPQSTPSWGGMLAQAAEGQLFTYAWWMMLFPGLFLVLTTLAFNLVGDGLRDALDPRPLPPRRRRAPRRRARTSEPPTELRAAATPHTRDERSHACTPSATPS